MFHPSRQAAAGVRGGPAANAGIRPGDVVVRVAGKRRVLAVLAFLETR